MVQIRRTGADDSFADRKCDLTNSRRLPWLVRRIRLSTSGLCWHRSSQGWISFPRIGDLGHVSYLSDCAVIAHRTGRPDASCRSDRIMASILVARCDRVTRSGLLHPYMCRECS